MANLVEQEVRVDEELRISYQGLTVEFTVVLQLNQGVCTAVLYYPPCLNFLVLFLSREKVQENFFVT